MKTNRTTHPNKPCSDHRRSGCSNAGGRMIVLLTLLVWLVAPAAFAQLTNWTGLAGDQKWSSAGNWDPATSPVGTDPTNDIVFGTLDTTGTAGPAGLSNNVVDVNTAIRSLQYSNVDSAFHTTYIPLGNTLSITPIGTLTKPLIFVGTGTAEGGIIINSTINGPGKLVVSNTASTASIINIRQGNATGLGQQSTLDLSGLDTFDATVNRILLGGDGGALANNRLAGILILARTNVIRLTGTPGMTLGQNNGNNGCFGDLQLGQTNVILCDSGILIGSTKSVGQVEFKTGLASPTAVFRNLAGTGRQALWQIGDQTAAGANSTACFAFVDFTLGTVDALVDTLIVGKGPNSGTGRGRGFFAFSAGVIDVNNMTVGTRFSSARNEGIGEFSVGNTAQLIVNSDLRLGMNLGGTIQQTTQPYGNLYLTNGGSVWVKGNIIDGASSGGLTAVKVDNSSLKVGGQIGKTDVNNGALENFNLTNATLTLTLSGAINANNPVCRVTNLTIATAVTINVQGGGFGVGQYPLIAYLSGVIGGDGYPVVALGSLPSRTFAYLSNNTTTSSIDLVVTNISTIKWEGNVAGGDWDINTTANWIDSVAGASTYLEPTIPGDAAAFDDTASGTTTVNLTTNLSPTTVTVSNPTKTYIFKGPGALGGSVGTFTKTGAALLIITNSGANAFGGALTINGGTVQLGLAANRLPTTANVTIANVAGAGLDLGDQNQALNSLAGGGASGGNVNLGVGNLQTSAAGAYAGIISGTGHYTKVGSGNQIFSGANLYGGGTTVNGGSLTLDNATGDGTGTGAIDIGPSGTLNIGNGSTSGSIPSSLVITNNGVLAFNRTDSFTLPNSIVGTGGVTKNNTNDITLLTANTYSGQTTINGGALRVSNPNALGTGTVYVPNSGDNVPNSPSSIIAMTARLELVGSINLTNAIQLDQKGGAYGDVPSVESVSGNNTLSGPMTWFIGGTYWTIRVDAGKLNITSPVVNTTFGTRNLRVEGAGDAEWSSTIPEGVGTTRLFKDGTGTLTLSGTNTYIGATYVYGGRVLVNGEIQSPDTVWVGDPTFDYSCTLGGTGVIYSAVFVDTNGIFAPGTSIGTLTILSTLTMVPGSTNVFEVNGSTLAHDQVVGLTGATYGGTLVISLSGGSTALTNGAAIQLFSGTGFSGAFAAIVPATPGPGKTWDTSTMTTDGTLHVSELVPPHITLSTHLGDGNFQFSGTGPSGAAYRVYATTNITLPLLSWDFLTSGMFTGGTFSFTDLDATNYTRRFYDVVTP